MKRFVMALLVAVCLTAVPAVVADVPVGDHISNVADDGSYRDNARGVWIDACGDEHALCPVTECPEAEECPEQEVCESEMIIALSCPQSALTQEEIDAIATTTVALIEFRTDNRPDFVNNFAVSAVVGGHHFRGVQARYKFFGIRVGRMDLSDFISVPGRSNDPLDLFNATSSSLITTEGGGIVCHNGITIHPATPGTLNGHLRHGDTLGPCDDENPDPDPFCGDGIQDPNEDCNTCPEDVVGICGDGDPDPRDDDPENLGFRRIDDTADTLEAFVYINGIFKGKQRECHQEDGNVKALCRLGLYVGGGLVRIEETQILSRNGILRSGDTRDVINLTATAGVDYTFPFRLTIGAGYHTEAGGLLHVGYGITW